MKTESEHSAPTSDSESPPIVLSAEQTKEVLKGIITEALEGIEHLDKEGTTFSVKELGYFVQGAFLQHVEALGETKQQKVALMLDFITGGGEAFNDFLLELMEFDTLH